jgi:hypothetical protein
MPPLVHGGRQGRRWPVADIHQPNLSWPMRPLIIVAVADNGAFASERQEDK